MADTIIGNIDRSSPIPVYYQIVTDIKNRILNHEWEIGDQLPTENDLAQQYEVSRITLRQALTELEKERIIHKQRGHGTFVSAAPAPFVTELNYSLVSRDQLTRDENTIEAKVLEQRMVTDLPEHISKSLKLQPGDPAVYIQRLYYRNGQPFAVNHSYINAGYVPGLEHTPLIQNSITMTMQKHYNLHCETVDDYVEITMNNYQESTLLQRPYNAPLLVVQGIAYTNGNVPLEFSRTYWPGDAVRLHLHLRLGENDFSV